MRTLPEMLAAVTRRNPSKPAILEGNRHVTYVGLLRRVHSLAAQLSNGGIKRGDPVALLLPNGIEFVIGFFAVAELGAIVVPLNTHYQQNELTYFIDVSDASTLITLKEFEPLCRRVSEKRQEPLELVVLDEEPEPQLGNDSPHEEPSMLTILGSNVHPEDDALYQYSSGSTGSPKRIARSHSNLLFELGSLAKSLGLSSDDRFLGVTPFSHVNGLVRSMLASLSQGATLVAMRDFKRLSVAQAIEKERITVFIAVPFMFSILAETNLRAGVDFSSLRLCISASAPLPSAMNRAFCNKYGFYVRQLYGSTETGTISVNLAEDIENSLESVGSPIDGVQVAVFRDDDTLAEVNEIGEVAVQSPAAIIRYHETDAGQGCFRNGYFFTGDVGRIDAKGNLYLLGRKKFFINKGGYKINPFEMESLLQEHPKVAEVVVVGVPTPYGDERVKAVIVPRGECLEEEIIEFCRGKIADFKVPSLIEFTQRLPKSPTGKILRKQLEENYPPV